MSKTATERKRAERSQKRAEGLVPIEVWVRPEHKGKLRAWLAKLLRS